MVSETDLSSVTLDALNLGKIGEFIHDGVEALQDGKNPLAKYDLRNIDPNERGAAYLLGKVIAAGGTIQKSTELVHQLTTDFRALDYVHLLDGFDIGDGAIKDVFVSWLKKVANENI